jgi:hypothetical protein
MEQVPAVGRPDMWLTCDSVQAFVVEGDDTLAQLTR